MHTDETNVLQASLSNKTKESMMRHATMMPQLLHVHRSVDTDSRRIRARFVSGFVRIRTDSRGFALMFGCDEKILIQKYVGIPMTWQKAGPPIRLSKPGTSDPFYNTKRGKELCPEAAPRPVGSRILPANDRSHMSPC